ncbi:hypothetical protein BDM02DRAFT_3120021 [Thelephora ganbajun]|uniref:Uncharacterized protein n=1 Tax=Thelephora ganbajun TaxID=370292 RepID=A0ACB6Z841_THEGA|nr:hypothetical protein BDM02DRAFT_3120021 [Thelephora ganbajun]
MTLPTISPRHRDLRQISIHACHDLAIPTVNVRVIQAINGQWLDLDRLLDQLCESRSIRTKLIHTIPVQKQRIGRRLPEAAKRGIIDPYARVRMP